MKKLYASALIIYVLLFAMAASAIEPVEIPTVPNAAGALIFEHDFENGEFDKLLPKSGSIKPTDEAGNAYTYKTGAETVVSIVDGNGGKVLKFDGSNGSDTYTIITPAVPLAQRVVLSFDVMSDVIPTTGRKEILKIGETTTPTNRAVDFLSDSGIYSNGLLFADYPYYEMNKWYHFDFIIGFGETTEDRNIIVQLTVDGKTYRQDYTHSATMNQLASLRFATKAGFGSIYLDNLKLFKDVPSSFVIDTEAGIKIQNNTDTAQNAVFIACLYEDEGNGPRLIDIYSEQVALSAQSATDITGCNVTKPADTSEKTYTLQYRLWDFGIGGTNQIVILTEKQG